MAHIKIYADKEYSFKGMRDPSGWIASIEQARENLSARGVDV